MHNGPMSEHEDDGLIVVREMDVLVERQGDVVSLCSPTLASQFGEEPIFLGKFEGRAWHAARARSSLELSEGLSFSSARSLFAELGETELNIVGRALASVEFEDTHRFCGRCASPTELSLPEPPPTQPTAGERARSCPACGFTFHPRIPPAVIVLVERGSQILLARSARFPPGRFSALAGFVEIGESLEDTAHREVREEVGVAIEDLRYFGSQPWPFGRSLMVGFRARYSGGEVRPDGTEIVEAAWFEPDRLPLLPPKVSIARKLIDDFLARS
jgi:NAD+ diphosphatase